LRTGLLDTQAPSADKTGKSYAAVYPFSHSESSVLILLFGAGAVLAGAPFLGMWLLKKRSERARLL
jgi:hypothetical protein